MELLTVAKSWITNRWSERSTWDGGVIIGFSVLALVASPLIKYAAWAGLVYGAWRVVQKENLL